MCKKLIPNLQEFSEQKPDVEKQSVTRDLDEEDFS